MNPQTPKRDALGRLLSSIAANPSDDEESLDTNSKGVTSAAVIWDCLNTIDSRGVSPLEKYKGQH